MQLFEALKLVLENESACSTAVFILTLYMFIQTILLVITTKKILLSYTRLMSHIMYSKNSAHTLTLLHEVMKSDFFLC